MKEGEVTQPGLFTGPVDEVPPRPVVPGLLDTFTARVHYAALHCRSRACFEGRPNSPHDTSEIRRTLVDFTGKLLDAFEVSHFGNPLPEEERLWLESEEEPDGA